MNELNIHNSSSKKCLVKLTGILGFVLTLWIIFIVFIRGKMIRIDVFKCKTFFFFCKFDFGFTLFLVGLLFVLLIERFGSFCRPYFWSETRTWHGVSHLSEYFKPKIRFMLFFGNFVNLLITVSLF